MPLPLLLFLSIPIVFQATRKTREDINMNLNSKTLAILGEPQVGKTRLLIYAHTGVVPETEETSVPENVRDGYFTCHSDKTVFLRKAVDQPGTKGWKDQWKQMVIEADTVLYLVRADKLFSPNPSTCEKTQDRIERDMALINEWLNSNPKTRKLFLIGTHCDLLPNLDISSQENLKRLQEMVPYSQRFCPILATLKTKSGLQQVVGQFLN